MSKSWNLDKFMNQGQLVPLTTTALSYLAKQHSAREEMGLRRERESQDRNAPCRTGAGEVIISVMANILACGLVGCASHAFL